MNETTILSLMFAAYIVYSMYATSIPLEEAKELGFTHYGHMLGMRFYLCYRDDQFSDFSGSNIASDLIVANWFWLIGTLNGGKLNLNVKEL